MGGGICPIAAADVAGRRFPLLCKVFLECFIPEFPEFDQPADVRNTAFLVNSNDELRSRIGEILASDELRLEMGRRAMEWSEKFTWDKYTRECEEILEDVIREGKS